jgi:arginine N-succinyltransferase
MTSLPKDRALLAGRIQASVESAQFPPPPMHEASYLFVLEEAETGTLHGVCGCYGAVGGAIPYFAYRVDRIRTGEAVGMPRDLPILRVIEERSGPAMIGSLLLNPEARGHGVGRFLSLVRFLFIAEHRHRFDERVIAELRGWIRPDGSSPFWEAIGQQFFRMSLPEADMHTHLIRGFVHHLLPREPIFIDLLPEEARNVIGAVHPATRAAMRILELEGFELAPWIDPFEAGPVMIADVDHVRSVKRSHVVTLVADASGGPLGEGGFTTPAMVTNRGLSEFRATLAPVRWRSDSEASLPGHVMDLLGVGIGDQIRACPLDKVPARAATHTRAG